MPICYQTYIWECSSTLYLSPYIEEVFLYKIINLELVLLTLYDNGLNYYMLSNDYI